VHPVREMHMKDHVLAATVSFLVYPITDRDCVAHRPSTSRLYFDVGVDFTGLFFIWRYGQCPRGRPSAPPSSPLRPHVDPRRLIIASTDRDAFADFAHRRLRLTLIGLISRHA